MNLIERFESKVAKTDGCWFWMGGKNAQGYGNFSICGRTVGAHKFAWTLYRDEVGPLLTIDHLCKNRACVNPNHMELVSARVNKSRAGKIQPLRALRYDPDSSPIRVAREKAGMSRKDLAEAADVSEPTIVNIECGKHRPRPTTLRKLCAVLDLNPFTLQPLASALAVES